VTRVEAYKGGAKEKAKYGGQGTITKFRVQLTPTSPSREVEGHGATPPARRADALRRARDLEEADADKITYVVEAWASDPEGDGTEVWASRGFADLTDARVAFREPLTAFDPMTLQDTTHLRLASQVGGETTTIEVRQLQTEGEVKSRAETAARFDAAEASTMGADASDAAMLADLSEAMLEAALA